MPYAASAGTANTANYANSAGSVGGITNPMSKDVGAGGVGAIVFGVWGSGGFINPGDTVPHITVRTYRTTSDGITDLGSSQQYGGTWRNIGASTGSYTYDTTMWQRIA